MNLLNNYMASTKKKFKQCLNDRRLDNPENWDKNILT